MAVVLCMPHSIIAKHNDLSKWTADLILWSIRERQWEHYLLLDHYNDKRTLINITYYNMILMVETIMITDVTSHQ